MLSEPVFALLFLFQATLISCGHLETNSYYLLTAITVLSCCCRAHAGALFTSCFLQSLYAIKASWHLSLLYLLSSRPMHKLQSARPMHELQSARKFEKSVTRKTSLHAPQEALEQHPTEHYISVTLCIVLRTELPMPSVSGSRPVCPCARRSVLHSLRAKRKTSPSFGPRRQFA